jgi:hypothetical protein
MSAPPEQPKQPPPDREIPMSRALGRFFGHLWTAATGTPPADKPRKQTVSKTREEAEAEINGRPVIVRRTTIEEIEFKDDRPQT